MTTSEPLTQARGEAGAPVEPRVPARTRAVVLAGLVVLALFSAACLAYNAPPSPARDRLSATASAFMNPYFSQDWQLFAPTPGDQNRLIHLRTRLRLPTGQLVETSPVEIEDSIDRMPRQLRVNPSKVPGVLLAFDQDVQHYSAQVADIKKLPEVRRAAAQAELDRTFAGTFLRMRRFFSARAAVLYPGREIVAVRATFENQPIVPFSQRYVSPQPVEPLEQTVETSWLAYAPGVAR